MARKQNPPCRWFPAIIGGLSLGVLHTQCAAQPTERNPLQVATDAFGISVGEEKIGVYTSDNVRGFSPTIAGNVRIDGLYFDQAGELNKRLSNVSTIRVGPAAQAYPFPAPTGIVDYRLRTAGSTTSESITAGLADYAGPYLEVDFQLPVVKDKLGLVAGFGLKDDQFPDGTNSRNSTVALVAEWHPGNRIALRSFWTQMLRNGLQAQPVITVGGPWLPPRLRLRKFIGQRWTTNTTRRINAGQLADLDLGSGWTVRGGLFYSLNSDHSAFADLFKNVQQDGSSDHRIVADPSESTRSTSGEIRVERAFEEGSRQHHIYIVLRGRKRDASFGGSDRVDLGPSNVTVPTVLPEPAFKFGAQSYDHVRQFTGGLAYEMLWKGLGQLSLGIQKTRYRKIFDEAGGTSVHTQDSPTLFYGNVEALLSRRLALFASITRGLEESGIAPDNAVNRGEALSAVRTQQIDGGAVFQATSRFKVLAAVFEVRKPYVGLDATNAFRIIGEERHRGLEVSVSGYLTSRLNVVAGAVLLDARTTRDSSVEANIGARPIGSSPELIRLSAEYSVPRAKGFSVDIGVDHDGKRVASTDNAIRLPPRTILRAGLRYRFHVGRINTQMRVLVDNLTDNFEWALTSGGGFKVDVGRRVTEYLGIDF